MALTLYQKFLYRETLCTHRRESREARSKCKQPYGFGTCDLEICPVVQEHFANVIFDPEGIKLVIKEPREDRIGGAWKEEILDIKVGEENNKEEVLETVQERTQSITDRNQEVLIQRIHDIYRRYEFLEKRDNLPAILGGKREEAVFEEEEVFKEEEELFAEEREELFGEESERESEEDQDEKTEAEES
ncbi:MAG: hypothetical protein GWO20_19630 [Candidatus Korarchaeota archaeon]|nr:hypothetical protein [Candidatus Korarchaeota archaeon]NIU85445.1 hypothetical protein [Candidatus Thorarchaeota archaeon]NIW15557.1 hypothetical protein [Candidatus Thorarchaeota archaeon]NIW53498.1 hypothetical protein [Candidatus Korarchaeota archaeon]